MGDSYLLLCTGDEEILTRADALLRGAYKYTDLPGGYKPFRRIYHIGSDRGGIFYSIGLNMIFGKGNPGSGTAEPVEQVSGSTSRHELLSQALLNSNGTICLCSDYMGVFTHYYFKSDNSFIASDNLLLVANLSGADFSFEGVCDSILFKKPFGTNTWYHEIYCLTAGNSLKLDLNRGEISVSGATDFRELLEGSDADPADTFRELFSSDYSGQLPALSLSAGSDSRTVLAGLLASGARFTSFSWGGSDYIETGRIRKLAGRFGLDWQIIDFEAMKRNYIELHLRSVFFSGGLIPAPHHFYFRSKLPLNSILFEGYGGSEFVKGEHSDGMFSNILKEIIVDNEHLGEILSRKLAGLSLDSIATITEYLSDMYHGYFSGINTDRGKESFALYLLNFLPSKIFGGIFKPSDSFGLRLIEPYFSPAVLASIFGKGMGIRKNLSLRADFAGPIRALEPQSLMMQKLHPALYRTMLDRNVRYSEWDMPHAIIGPLRKLRQQLDRLRYTKFSISAQVDYISITGIETIRNERLSLADHFDIFSGLQGCDNNTHTEVMLTALKRCAETDYIRENL